MLECNLELFSCVFLLEKYQPRVCVILALHGTGVHGVAQGLQASTSLYTPSYVSVGWSKLVNHNFLSHDIRCVLYLVILYGDIPF